MPDYLAWRTASKTMTDLTARTRQSMTLTGHGDAEQVQVSCVTANLVSVWGLSPSYGRLFQTGEDALGRPLVAVLAHQYWQRAFNSDPTVLGKTLFLDGKPITIVGVMETAIEAYGYSSNDF